DQVPDLMKRDDPDVVRRKRAAGGVERGERDDAAHEVAILVPGEVGLPRPLNLELQPPAEAHFGRCGIRVEVEADRDAGLLPALERAAHRVEEARLEVGGRPGPQEHPHRSEDAVVPAMQHRVLALGDDLVQIGVARAGATAVSARATTTLVESTGAARGGRCLEGVNTFHSTADTKNTVSPAMMM